MCTHATISTLNRPNAKYPGTFIALYNHAMLINLVYVLLMLTKYGDRNAVREILIPPMASPVDDILQ